jgi:hypothetical protein
MSSKEDTSSSGVVVLFNWRWQCHYILDNIKHMFYNMNKGGIIYGTKYTEFFRNK